MKLCFDIRLGFSSRNDFQICHLGLFLSYPYQCCLFQLIDFYGSAQSRIELTLNMGQELDFTVKFDPAFKDDLFSRVAEGEVVITYREHPHYDSLKLKGEVSMSLQYVIE